MTFDEFIKKWEGSGIDFDGHYGDQCVDLYREYVKDVLGLPQSPPVRGAEDIWDSYLPDHYERILNTIEAIPQKGDIMIFNFGEYGHVSIFISGGQLQFTSFDQNYPLGSFCAKRNHDYYSIIGWLRPKNGIVDGSPSIEAPMDDQTKIDLGKYGVMEIQRIRGELAAKAAVEKKYKALLENPQEGGITEGQIVKLEEVIKSSVKVEFERTNDKIDIVQKTVDTTEDNLTGDRKGFGEMQVDLAALTVDFKKFKELLTGQTEKITKAMKIAVDKAILTVSGKVGEATTIALNAFTTEDPELRKKTFWEKLQFWKK